MRKGRKDSASAGPSMGMCHQEHHPQVLGGYRCRTERVGDPALGVITGRESSVKHQETFLPPPRRTSTMEWAASGRNEFLPTLPPPTLERQEGFLHGEGSAFFKMSPFQEQKDAGWVGVGGDSRLGVRAGVVGRGPEGLVPL